MFKQYAIFISIILFCCAIFLSNEIYKKPSENSLSVNFLNVGQGDSALIQKDDFQILIDGGPDDSVLAEMGKIMPPLDRKIEIIVLTHPHADHLAGINQVLDRYEVGEIISSGVISGSSLYLQFLEKVKTKNITLIAPTLGNRRDFADNASIYFLWPGQKFMDREIDNLNNSSLVSKVCYFENCVLLMGDLEKGEQQTMFDYYKNLGEENIFKSSIIKVAHHGSSTGLLPSLYELIIPKYAVISVGKDNQFGHPHQATLDYLNQKSIKILRTDQDGTIRFKLEQNNIVRD